MKRFVTLFCAVVLLALCVPAGAQTLSTNNVIFNLGDIVGRSGQFVSVKISTVQPLIVNGRSYSANPQALTIANDSAQITNNYVIFTNLVCGPACVVTIADLYSTTTTNFTINNTNFMDASGNVIGLFYIGPYVPGIGQFYANTITTNFIVGGSTNEPYAVGLSNNIVQGNTVANTAANLGQANGSPNFGIGGDTIVVGNNLVDFSQGPLGLKAAALIGPMSNTNIAGLPGIMANAGTNFIFNSSSNAVVNQTVFIKTNAASGGGSTNAITGPFNYTFNRLISSTYFSPLGNSDWAYDASAILVPSYAGEWDLDVTSDINDRSYAFLLSPPLNTTNFVYTFTCRSLNTSTVMRVDVNAGTGNNIYTTNFTVTNGTQVLSANVNIGAAWTNQNGVQFVMRPQGAVGVGTNLAVDYLPAPSFPLLTNGSGTFKRVAIAPKNLFRNAGGMNSSTTLYTLNPYPYTAMPYDVSTRAASDYSYIEFYTSCTNPVIEVHTENTTTTTPSANYEVRNAFGQMVWQGSYTNSGPVYNGLFQLTGCTNNLNVVRWTCGYSAYGYGSKGVPVAIYIGTNDFVNVSENNDGAKVFLIGDSKLSSGNVTTNGYINTLGLLLENFYGFQVYTHAESGASLYGLVRVGSNYLQLMDKIRNLKPSYVIDNMAFNDYNGNTYASLGTTNGFATDKARLYDDIHRASPGTVIISEPFEWTSYLGTAINGLYPQDFITANYGVCAVRTNYVTVLNWTNQLVGTGYKPDGIHNNEPANMKFASMLGEAIWTNTLVPSGLAYADAQVFAQLSAPTNTFTGSLNVSGTVTASAFSGNGSGLTNFYVIDTSGSNVTWNLVSGQYAIWKTSALNTLYLVGNGQTNAVFGTQIVPIITIGTNFYIGN